MEELVLTCQAFFNLKIGFDCNPDTIAFNEEKFFSTRNSCKDTDQSETKMEDGDQSD